MSDSYYQDRDWNIGGLPCPSCEVCEAYEMCKALDTLKEIRTLRATFPEKDYVCLPYNPDPEAGGGPEVYSEGEVEEWLEKLDKILQSLATTVIKNE